MTGTDLTLGVTLVGLMVTGCLFGVTTAQTGWYFRHYPKDRQLLKVMVGAVWLLEATHLGLYLATMYIYLVDKNGLNFGSRALPWSSNAQLLVNPCTICTIQSFYASRIWQFSRRRMLLAVMVLFISTTWLFSIVLFAKTVTTDTVAEYILLAPYDIAMSVMTASTDMLLCGALVVLLSAFRKDTEGADRLINKLLIFTVNTGLLTAIFAVVTVIMVLALPTTSLFVMFYYIGTRLYSISLLATLNARIDLRIQAERMGERPLPEIQVTAPQGLTNKKSLQATTLHRTDLDRIVVTMPSELERSGTTTATTTTTTGDESSTPAPILAPRIHCESGRCYVVPDGDFGLLWTPDFLADTPPARNTCSSKPDVARNVP